MPTATLSLSKGVTDEFSHLNRKTSEVVKRPADELGTLFPAPKAYPSHLSSIIPIWV